MPKKKDVWLIVAVLAAALLMLLASRLMPKKDISMLTPDVTLAPDAIEYAEATLTPEATEAPQPTDTPVPTQTQEATAEPKESVAPAGPALPMGPMGPGAPQQAEEIRGYVVVTVGGRQYGDPIPMDRDKILTIKQANGEINKIHITPDSVDMESSTCDNQDCVNEGIITLDNYETRILGTYIICLPNSVTLEMVPVE